ncbi:MAG: DJ-1/PfpI family protein [Nitrospira sp.]|nr:DJ-1/PfpI family protein [Nitrospira sp.]
MEDLSGKRVAVFVEHKFIPEEIESYRDEFGRLGAEVEFVSRIWIEDHRPAFVSFLSDVDPLDANPLKPPSQLRVKCDVSYVEKHLDDYAALIMAANYTSVRLRWDFLPKTSLSNLTDTDIQNFNALNHVQQPPVVRLFARAMKNREIVKGALCHGLWVFTPFPQLLKGRRVTCHSVVMADVLNCNAKIELNRQGIVVDDDLVTGFSLHEVKPFINAVADCIRHKTGSCS